MKPHDEQHSALLLQLALAEGRVAGARFFLRGMAVLVAIALLLVIIAVVGG